MTTAQPSATGVPANTTQEGTKVTNRSDPPSQRPPDAKMWMRVYTVTRDGTVTPPRATVTVPYGFEPALEFLGTRLPPCACPIHRTAGTER
ncbi:hypothetical protein [Streptomyces sp. NPDC046805]|uniref:hypothetical protein n=1 Tax=Streptomyces sp. NPDC046805 TaxID=3155134 RepID=UPI0033F23E22